VFGEAGRAVASVMLCLDEVRRISDWERRIAEFAAHMAGIAIERDRAVSALASTERQLRLVAEERAREESRRKDEFLATLAHELRNPLAPVRHGLDVLRMPLADPEMRVRVVDMMERQIAHMVRLVDDLLEVSRITRGKIELRRETVDLASVVRSAVEAAAPAVEAGHHRLSVNLLAEPVLVDGDPVRLAQVVGNLLNNAAKYTEDGGHIRVKVARRDGHAEITVRDTGIGPDRLPHVFELFTQIDRTSGRAQGGLGIGLALVANLVRMHGGTVEAHSDGPGCGSDFVVMLPLAPADARRVVGSGGGDLVPSASRRPILVVDDNRDAADSLSMLLELAGRDVSTAYDGAAGLEAIREQHPEVVFLDLGMPGMDGYAVASAVRRDPNLHDVKLVALTGWGSEEDRRRSQDAGFDHHLVKPVDASTVETILSKFARAS
jgi:signal transduction histidine kinase/ActR/RegA family two-component response regulator